jgi:hypothetical protein
MRRWDVERVDDTVDLAALGKCGSRIGLVSAHVCVLRKCWQWHVKCRWNWVARAQLQASSYFW